MNSRVVNKKKGRLVLRIIVIFGCIIIILCSSSVMISYKGLQATKWQIASEKIGEPLRIAIISDLHSRRFGQDNRRLIKKIEQQNADLLLMTGDMIDDSAEDSTDVLKLIKALSGKIPVYYALGNHEISYREKEPDFLDRLKNAGAHILEEHYEDIKVNGNRIRIGGMYGYAFQIEGEETQGLKFMSEFVDTDAFQIMMYHRPESYVFGNAGGLWGVDMAVSGHIHGGQIILPGIGGLYGAELGWFPEYTYGQYRIGKTEFFLTRGLGSGREMLPRFNNIPEIMVIDVAGK